jgi:hypothetical protein
MEKEYLITDEEINYFYLTTRHCDKECPKCGNALSHDNNEYFCLECMHEFFEEVGEY